MAQFFVPLSVTFGREFAVHEIPIPVAPFTPTPNDAITPVIGTFADDTEGDAPPEIFPLLSRTNREAFDAGGGRFRLGVGIGGVELFVFGAGLAYPRRDNTYFVHPTDIGTNPGQIPPSMASNLASTFRLHPSTFLRETSKIRGLRMRPELRIFEPITSATEPPFLPTIEAVVRAPTMSRWLIIIDSTPIIIGVQHPAGSDLRRPRDVWNQILSPALTDRNTGTGFAAGSVYVGYPTPSANTFVQTGLLREVSFIEYAEFLSFHDGDNEEPIIQRVVQTVPPPS